MRVGKNFSFANNLPTNQHQNVLRAAAYRIFLEKQYALL